MDFLPFSSVDEAHDNAKLLCRAFSYCSIAKKNRETGQHEDLSLQQTQNLIAKLFGFARWEDLTARLIKGTDQVKYINRTRGEKDVLLVYSKKILSIIPFDSTPEKVLRALTIGGFGTDYRTRNLNRKLLHDKLIDKLEKFQELQALSAVQQYHSRYNQHRNFREIQIMERNYERAVAKVLGTKMPRKINS